MRKACKFFTINLLVVAALFMGHCDNVEYVYVSDDSTSLDSSEGSLDFSDMNIELRFADASNAVEQSGENGSG